MRRPLIVGEAPSMRTARPLHGRSGERLAALSGATLDELRRRYRLANLLGWWPGPDASGKGSAFPTAAAREAARLRRLDDGSLLLGRRVAAAYGLGCTVPFLEWLDVAGAVAAVVPHPSGVSRWWNEPENERAAREFLRAAWRDLDRRENP